MPPVTILYVAGAEMQDTIEDGDKHAGLIVATEFVVQHGQNQVGLRLLSDRHSPEGFGNRHKERGWDAFAGDVANRETEMIVIDKKEIIKVATNFTGRLDSGMQFEFRALRKRGKDTR